MMTPEDTERFKKLIETGHFNQASYDKLIKRFELTDIDLEAEYTKIVKKESNLSRRQRDLVPDFLAVRDMLKEKKEKDAAAATEELKEKETISADTANAIVDAVVEEKTK